jgi:hypothetical protein
MKQHRTGRRRPMSRSVVVLAVLAAVAAVSLGAPGIASAHSDNPADAQAGITAFDLTATLDHSAASITGYNQGFSVESADFAHGFITDALLGKWLKTLGPHGVLRIGGYSMDLVWPAFGAYRDAPAPPQAIGGTVDQSDMNKLKKLLDDTGWRVTLGVPLKSVIDPSQIKNPTEDPSPDVTLDQAVAEVVAAYHTLGKGLMSVEIGNEFDNVTTLTPAQYYATMKEYYDAINKALPSAHLKVTGPSANSSSTNTKLDGFISAVQADTSVIPSHMISELSSHYYPGSHCGTATTTIPQLMSSTTYINTRAKLDGIMAEGARLGDTIPSVINETNSASCSGQPGVSNSYATSLWSLDYLLQAAQSGVSRLQFHTNTAAICGDLQARTSPDYPISYRYYGAFCAPDQAALDANQLSAAPLYYGIWAFRQVPQGQFVDLNLPDSALPDLRAYGIKGRQGKLTVVLINVTDPASANATTDAVTVGLPGHLRGGRATTLSSSAPGGLASTDASAITLGGRTVTPSGTPSGTFRSTYVPVSHTGSATIDVAPGTAQIITFSPSLG